MKRVPKRRISGVPNWCCLQVEEFRESYGRALEARADTQQQLVDAEERRLRVPGER